ncbi:uncharacterized protein UV8b_06552 [Ustilaginoidea virens]|uniref:Uncharacterized protein n=1 Tax=Ustilaginoidea virens TaxID=1159556 RepID=A0A8E5MJY5_USTVR|nr:uncharacterized protein UV8b_06552 [Ustilaginoidea virens]QUC22311.1 hypothetical protein UV8b_06552 [Ustilaginoidea virens]
MLKSSTVDVDHLIAFVKANGIVPDWMNMQLPLGRNMSQCISVVEHMTAESRLPKRWSTGSSGESASNGLRGGHVAGDAHYPRAKNPSTPNTATPVAILPRPASWLDQSYSIANPPQRAQPKKRGRPSRADKAKRDLRPNLPPHLAPRPYQATAQRPILPAVGPNGDLVRSRAQATSGYALGMDEGARSSKRRCLGAVAQKQPAGSSSAAHIPVTSSSAL